MVVNIDIIFFSPFSLKCLSPFSIKCLQNTQKPVDIMYLV